MGYTSMTVATRSCPSVRRHLTTGVTVASAGILTLGLVVVTPDFDARTEVRAVQLTASALPTAAQRWDAQLREFISNHTARVVPAGAVADDFAAVVNTSSTDGGAQLTVDSTTDPATNTQSVAAAALATPTAAGSILDPILGIVTPILGLLLNPQALLLFGPIILLVVLACPPCAVFNFFGGIISSFLIDLAPVPALAAATTAMVEGTTTDAPSTDEPALSDVSSAAATPKSAADTSPAPRSKKLDESTTEAETVNEPTSAETAKDATETVGADEVSTEKPTAKESESAGDASESTKPADRPETPRPVVRDSLGADKKTSDMSHRGNGGRATTKEPAGGRPATAGSSSADSSSTDSAASGGGSSESNSGGSE